MSDWERDWPAPAKINLFLHVVGRREDGYHLLQTVFRLLDFGDSLRFSPRADGEIALATALPGVPPEADLTVRAARALKAARKVSSGGTAAQFPGVTLYVEKRIPLGGGLGGGSSDAATTLMALNHLWGCGLSTEELQRIGLGLGADVPVFIHGRSCFAEGVGERFTDVALPPAGYLVTVPPVSVPTAEVFRAPDLVRDTPAIDPASWRPKGGGNEGGGNEGRNDLEPVACRLYPEIARHLDWLRRRGPARMTGSGACCFAEFDTEAEARAALRELPADMTGFVACGLDSHPLAELT